MTTPADTRVEMTQIVLPTYTNNLGTVFGGQIAAWIDVCAAVSAQRLARGPVVTASMDELHFLKPVREGMVAILRSQVNRSWTSSIEVGVRVEAEHPFTGEIDRCCTAFLTFVALDEHGAPRKLPPLEVDLDNPDNRRRWEQAQLRRDARLEMRELRRQHSGR